MKKVLLALTAAVIAFQTIASPVLAVMESPFIDVKNSEWYHGDVMYAYENDLIKGTGENMFEPDANITRAAIATIIHRAEKEPSYNKPEYPTWTWIVSPFDDVSINDWFFGAVVWAHNYDIVKGLGDNSFMPNAYILRSHLALILARYAQVYNIDLPELKEYKEFDDVKSLSTEEKETIEKLYKAGVINGKSENEFAPREAATRAEAAAIIRRLLELKK